jgi:hypothetical protein
MAWNRPDGRSGAPSVFIRVHPWYHSLLTATNLRLSGKALGCLLAHPIALTRTSEAWCFAKAGASGRQRPD